MSLQKNKNDTLTNIREMQVKRCPSTLEEVFLADEMSGTKHELLLLEYFLAMQQNEMR